MGVSELIEQTIAQHIANPRLLSFYPSKLNEVSGKFSAANRVYNFVIDKKGVLFSPAGNTDSLLFSELYLRLDAVKKAKVGNDRCNAGKSFQCGSICLSNHKRCRKGVVDVNDARRIASVLASSNEFLKNKVKGEASEKALKRGSDLHEARGNRVANPKGAKVKIEESKTPTNNNNAQIASKVKKAIAGLKGGTVTKGKSPDSLNKREKRSEVILKAQHRKLEELKNQFGDLLSDNPRNGHGGTPNITDNSKGRQMMRSQEKREERLRSLNRQIKEQEDKIGKTEWKIDRNSTVTKNSKKFTDKNPIHKGLVDLSLEGKLSQWERNPHVFFVKGLDKVALSTFDGKVGAMAKYKPKSKEDWVVVKKLIEQVNNRKYKNPYVEN